MSAVAWLRAPASARGALQKEGALAPVTLPALAFVVGAAVLVLLFATTKVIGLAEGLGGDGYLYAEWIRAWNDDVRQIGLHSYSAQRILVIGLVKKLMVLQHLPPTPAAIVRTFRIVDAVCMVVALGFSCLAAQRLRLSRAGFLFAVGGTFFHFAALSFMPFDPVLSDALAFMLASALFWLYLEKNALGIALVSVVGAFVWPGFAYTGMALLAFPRPEEDGLGPATPSTPSALDNAIAAVGAAVVAAVASRHVHDPPEYDALPAVLSLSRLSIALVTIVTFVVLRSLVRVEALLRELVRRDRRALAGKVLAVLVMIVVAKGIAWVASRPTRLVHQHGELKLASVLLSIVARAVQRPLVFVVAHASFFGPAALFVMLFWKRVCDEARRLGAGLHVVLGLTFLYGLNSESRGMVHVAPIVLPLAALACARMPWTPRRLWELAAIAVFASKIWYAMTISPKLDETYFVHMGPWMPNDGYLVQGLATIGVAIWAAWTQRTTPRTEEMVWLSEEQPI